jgi:hypothetical protein
MTEPLRDDDPGRAYVTIGINSVAYTESQASTLP